MPVLASVPMLTEKDLQIDKSRIIPHTYLVKKPQSWFGEEIRTLRASIQLSDVNSLPRVILVTSAVAGEGKSTIAMSIAQSAGTNFPRVLFVDCDLRRSAVTKLFGLINKPGLVDVLAGSIPVEYAIHKSVGASFFIIGRGASTLNPPDLLSSGRMEMLLQQLKATFDYVVLDSPAIGLVIDATVLTKLVDKIVFVTRWNETPRDIVARAVKQLQRQKKVSGIVLNQVDTKLNRRYGGYYNTKYYRDKIKRSLGIISTRVKRL
jgi:capsular exopolysaccharide synthesis family protein